MPKYRKPARTPEDHHSTLNLFACVQKLLEGGMIYDPDAYTSASQIIAICEKEQYRQLRKYDQTKLKLEMGI